MNLRPRDEDDDDNPRGGQRQRVNREGSRQRVQPSYFINRQNESRGEIIDEEDESVRSDFVIAIWRNWLEKYFFSQGSEVWVRWNNEWVAGSVERFAPQDPARTQRAARNRHVLRRNDEQEVANMMVTVIVKFENDNTHSCIWSDVFPRSPALVNKRNVMTPFCLDVFDRISNLDSLVLAQREREALEQSCRAWITRSMRWYFNVHYTDYLVAILLGIAINNGDPFELASVRGNMERAFGNSREIIINRLSNSAVNSDWEDNVQETLDAEEMEREVREMIEMHEQQS